MSKRQEPLYKWLRDNSDLNGGDMNWNFEKFLINSEGQIVGHWGTAAAPETFRDKIESLL